MRDRNQIILRMACVGLAALLVYQTSRIFLRVNPLARVTIPEVPTLTSTNAASAAGATNTVAGGTNRPATGTTNVPSKGVAASDTNVAASSTNLATANLTSTNASSNSVSAATNSTGTNLTAQLTQSSTNTTPLTNAVAVTKTVSETNVVSSTNVVAGTNTVVPTNAVMVGTNIVPTNLMASIQTNAALPRPPGIPPGGPGMPPGMIARPGMPGRGGPALPPPIQARVAKIIESEVFGAIPRPTPMALIGIAGDSALIRTPSGQTGWVKEDASLGEIKLLKIGINRVLIEQDGQSKELMIFSGMGGESLLSQTKEPNETTSK